MGFEFFFFFFDGKQVNFVQLKLKYNRDNAKALQSSSMIRCSTGLGKVLSQTWDTSVILATLASLWATL